jgi:hypothetical protein
VKIRRTAVAIVVPAISIVGLNLVSAAPASATPHCNSYGFLCIFQFHDYTGGEYDTQQSEQNWDGGGAGAAASFMNDKMSSVANRTQQTYGHVFQHDNYEGFDYCVRPNREIPNVSNDIENKSSSHNFAAGC